VRTTLGSDSKMSNHMPQTHYKASNIYVRLLRFKEKSSSLIRQLSQSSSIALQTIGAQ